MNKQQLHTKGVYEKNNKKIYDNMKWLSEESTKKMKPKFHDWNLPTYENATS